MTIELLGEKSVYRLILNAGTLMSQYGDVTWLINTVHCSCIQTGGFSTDEDILVFSSIPNLHVKMSY